ncbi:MAG: LytTR family transcriptional regulator [Firmicutes bacterium]|nr:LytTR family transcriptional regulator [Bacillota bacterium]
MEKIYLRDQERFYAFNTEDIMYFLIMERKTVIQCKEQNYNIRLPLSHIEPLLNDNFIRVHKSCILNLDNIVFYDNKKKKAKLINDEHIDTISDKYSCKIEKYFNEKLKI